MNFNRKLFKEAFIRGYKEAKRVLKEQKGYHTQLYTNLKKYAEAHGVVYKVTMTPMGPSTWNNQGWVTSRDIGEHGCTIHEELNGDPRKIDTVASLALFMTDDAELKRDPNSSGNALYIIGGNHQWWNPKNPGYEKYEFKFVPYTKDGSKVRPFGYTILTDFDAKTNRSDGLSVTPGQMKSYLHTNGVMDKAKALQNS